MCIRDRLSADAADDGQNESEAFQRALEASKLSGVPLMTHHTFSGVPLGPPTTAQDSPKKTTSADTDATANATAVTTATATVTEQSKLGCPDSLKSGDIYTHTFHGFSSTIVTTDDGLTIHPAVIKARERGVLFDVGHGQGSFNWTVVRTP